MQSSPSFRLQVTATEPMEIARILRAASEKISAHGKLAHAIFATDGNRVGSCGLDVDMTSSWQRDTETNIAIRVVTG